MILSDKNREHNKKAISTLIGRMNGAYLETVRGTVRPKIKASGLAIELFSKAAKKAWPNQTKDLGDVEKYLGIKIEQDDSIDGFLFENPERNLSKAVTI